MTVKSVFLGVLRKFFHTTIYKLHYLKMEIDEQKVKEKVTELTYPIKELNYNDFLKGATKLDEHKLESYKNRLKDGFYKAYGALIDDHLAYYSWVSYKKIGMPVETKPVYLKSNEGYLESDYCMPEYRGKGIHTQVMWYRLNELIKAGRNIAIITIMDGNTPALKPAFKCGFKDIGTFHCGLLFGKKYNTLERMLKRHQEMK